MSAMATAQPLKLYKRDTDDAMLVFGVQAGS